VSTEFDKSLQSVISPVALPVQMPLAKEAPAEAPQIEKEETRHSISRKIPPIVDSLAVAQASTRQFQILKTTFTPTEKLVGKVQATLEGSNFRTTKGYAKYIQSCAQAFQQDYAYQQEMSKIQSEKQNIKRERQKVKCEIYWKKAEDLFHKSYARIRDERVNIIAKDIPSIKQ